jgi:microtubule-associated protein tau
MNKVQVGSAPSPNLKTVRSKIGSLDNASYRPGGGNVKIENRKVDFSKTQPKIAAKNDAYVPGGGDKKVSSMKIGNRVHEEEVTMPYGGFKQITVLVTGRAVA